MDRDALRQTILEKLQDDMGQKFDNLHDRSDLRTDLGIDSVDLLQLVVNIQSEYGVILDSRDLQKVVLVGDFLDLLQAKLAASKRFVA